MWATTLVCVCDNELQYMFARLHTLHSPDGWNRHGSHHLAKLPRKHNSTTRMEPLEWGRRKKRRIERRGRGGKYREGFVMFEKQFVSVCVCVCVHMWAGPDKVTASSEGGCLLLSPPPATVTEHHLLPWGKGGVQTLGQTENPKGWLYDFKSRS